MDSNILSSHLYVLTYQLKKMSAATLLLSASKEVTASTTSLYPNIKSLITIREKEVLHLIAHEYSCKDIAAMLFISYETVNTHRKNIKIKLGVKNTAGMVRVAFEQGLLTI